MVNYLLGRAHGRDIGQGMSDRMIMGLRCGSRSAVLGDNYGEAAIDRFDARADQGDIGLYPRQYDGRYVEPAQNRF